MQLPPVNPETPERLCQKRRQAATLSHVDTHVRAPSARDHASQATVAALRTTLGNSEASLKSQAIRPARGQPQAAHGPGLAVTR
jgi:hypothetical protein